MKGRTSLPNILFATDLSKDSARAIEWLRWLCDRYGFSVNVLYALNLFPFGLSAEEIEQARSVAAEKFGRFVRKHRLNREPFTQTLVVGDPAVTVAEFVANHDVALVVLGSRAMGLNRLLSGSISEEVLRSVHCPALTVGPRAKFPRRTGKISRIFFPTDLARQAKSVLTHFDFLLKGDPPPELALAHFLPKESISVVERHKTRRSLRAKLIDLVPNEVRRQIDDVVVESCSPVKGILEFSIEGRADIIILAVKDAGPFTRAATHRPRSITHQIIESATCPVFTIRV